MGYCGILLWWEDGGFVCRNGGFFKAAVQYHPSLLVIEYAKNVAIPMCVLLSMDEDVAVSFAPLHSLLIIGTTGRGDLVRFVR